jgi:hypothetical protein
MILIPDRLRSKSEISAAAVTDCHIISASGLSAADILEFLSIDNDFVCHGLYSFPFYWLFCSAGFLPGLLIDTKEKGRRLKKKRWRDEDKENTR